MVLIHLILLHFFECFLYTKNCDGQGGRMVYKAQFLLKVPSAVIRKEAIWIRWFVIQDPLGILMKGLEFVLDPCCLVSEKLLLEEWRVILQVTTFLPCFTHLYNPPGPGSNCVCWRNYKIKCALIYQSDWYWRYQDLRQMHYLGHSFGTVDR